MTARALLTRLLHALGSTGLALLACLAAFIAGQVLGQRDAELAFAVTRHTQAARCAPGEVAVAIVRSPADPAQDLWSCSSGSARLRARAESAR